MMLLEEILNLKMDILGMANDLNKQKFKENDISENSYYKMKYIKNLTNKVRF